jgi:hypothetical protein
MPTPSAAPGDRSTRGHRRWAAFEVELGPGLVDEAADALRRFADRVDTSKRAKPAMLGVIVGSGYGYARDDGVHVIPVGAVGP